MSERHDTINISTVTLLKVVFIMLLIWFLWAIRAVLLIFLISIIISSAIDPVADFLQKRRIPRALSVLIVYAIFLGLIALIGFLIVPPMTEQFNQIKDADVYQSFVDKVGVYRENLSHSSIGRSIDNSVKEFAGGLGGTLFQTTKGVLTGIVSAITILVISFYLTIEENGMKNFLRHLAPYKHQAYIAKLVSKIQYKMGAWVLGQLILSAVIFGLTFLGLTLLHVQYALVLALLAGLFEVIPIIGPFISGAVAVFLTFIQSPALAVAVVILWIVTQQLEAHIIVPIVMSRSVGINPVMVILAVLVGGTLGGIVGILIAIPTVSGITVFVTDLMEGNVGDGSG
ncbi:MAG: AI-2E family transporter [Candidatus Doudnabacteria bacterium]|nr:AI-2E family transporter [Candidatus Doudnabacteria bacterium]